MEFTEALEEEISRLKARLEKLVGLSSTPIKAKRGRRAKNAPKPANKAKRTTSPQLRAQRVLQGQYMGHVRRLTADQKKKISAIREKAGYQKAISAAKKLAK